MRHKAGNREVDMQPVPAGMPLGRPRVRQPLAAQTAPKLPEEPRHMPAKLNRIVTPLARVRQRPEPIEPIRGPVPANLLPRPSRRRSFRSKRIRGSVRPLAPFGRRHQRTTRLARLRIQRQRPNRPSDPRREPPNQSTITTDTHRATSINRQPTTKPRRAAR